MSSLGRPLMSEEDLLRRLERAAGELRPDPLFRRRLRLEVVNRHVAAREGLLERPRRPRREMGRLGRAVLYASLVTALSVTAVGAAAQDALPGDALYPIKRQLEELRLQIAPPGLRDDLLAMELDERLAELEALAGRGDWNRADQAAAAAAEVAARLDALGIAPGAGEQARLDAHIEHLSAILARAPEAARSGLERALQAISLRPQQEPSGSPGSHGGGQPGALDDERIGSSVAPSLVAAPTPGPDGSSAQSRGDEQD